MFPTRALSGANLVTTDVERNWPVAVAALGPEVAVKPLASIESSFVHLPDESFGASSDLNPKHRVCDEVFRSANLGTNPKVPQNSETRFVLW